MPADDEHWEEDIDWDSVDFDIVEDMCHGEQPPDLSETDLADLDGQAMREEVEKLTGIGVVKVVKDHDRDPAGKFVDLKEVFRLAVQERQVETQVPHCLQETSKQVRALQIHFHQRRLEGQFDFSCCFIWYMAGRFCH